MRFSLLVAALFLTACSSEEDGEECVRYKIIYDGDDTLPLLVHETHQGGEGGNGFPSVAIARGVNATSWFCSSPPSRGPVFMTAWVDADRSCELEGFPAPPCEPSSGDPFISFDTELGHGFHVVTLNFDEATPYP